MKKAKTEKTIRVLGISPGTRKVGLAVLDQHELIDWRLREFTGPWNKTKRTIILNSIERTILKYQPTVIAMKLPTTCRSSAGLNYLVRHIQKLAEHHQIHCHGYTLQELLTMQNQKTTELISDTFRSYPELHHTYQAMLEHPTNQYKRIFEAVLVAKSELKKYPLR